MLTFLSTFLAAPQHVRAQSDAIDGGGWLHLEVRFGHYDHLVFNNDTTN